MPEQQRTRAGVLITLVLAGLAMIGPFAIDTVFPAFGVIGQEFEVDSTAMQQVTSLYMLAFAVMSIFHGPISDAVGRKPVMIVGLTGFAVGNVISALAPSLTVLLISRVLQGAFAGAATIISRVVIRDMFAGAQAQKLMSQVMMIFSIAPALAPIVGGWILTVGAWPTIFWAITGYGLLLIVAVAVLLPETQPAEKRQPLELGRILASLVEVGTKPAMIRLALTMSMGFAGYFIYIVGAPIIVMDLLGQGEQDFWKLFVPLISGTMLGSYLSGRLADRIERNHLINSAMPVALAAAVVNVVLVALSPTLPWVLIGPTLLAVAIGTSFPVLNLEILDLFPDQRGAAASVGTFAALIFNSLLAGVLVPIIAKEMLHVAIAGAGFLALANIGWRWHVRAASTRTSGRE